MHTPAQTARNNSRKCALRAKPIDAQRNAKMPRKGRSGGLRALHSPPLLAAHAQVLGQFGE